jgi:hypothetical protein
VSGASVPCRTLKPGGTYDPLTPRPQACRSALGFKVINSLPSGPGIGELRTQNSLLQQYSQGAMACAPSGTRHCLSLRQRMANFGLLRNLFPLQNLCWRNRPLPLETFGDPAPGTRLAQPQRARMSDYGRISSQVDALRLSQPRSGRGVAECLPAVGRFSPVNGVLPVPTRRRPSVYPLWAR